MLRASIFRTAALLATSLSLAAPLLAADIAPGQSQLASNFARSALLGMQLSVQNGLHQGKFSPDVAKCVQALDPSSFRDIFAAQLAENLNQSELQAAEVFFSTAVGKKYTQYGLLQVYISVGEKPPEPLPTFSDSEYKELEAFSHTTAGDKLITRKILQNEAVQRALGGRIQNLLKSCATGARLSTPQQAR